MGWVLWPSLSSSSCFSPTHPSCEQVLAAVCSPVLCHLLFISCPLIIIHEQLLVRLGVGGVSSRVLYWSMHHPPHEQLLVRLEVHGALSMVGVVVVRHLSAMVSGLKGVRGASVMWCMCWEVPIMWVSHSLGLPALLAPSCT
jgi:hypothetical protein